jgi:hypothetical protein
MKECMFDDMIIFGMFLFESVGSSGWWWEDGS